MDGVEESHKKIPTVVLIMIIIQIIFIAIIVAIINNLNLDSKIQRRNDEPKIAIENFLQNVANMPNNYIEDIQNSLTDTLELNVSNLDLPRSSATIRDGTTTLREFDEYGFAALSFIVDILDLQQSYQVYYKYPLSVDYDDPFIHNPRAVLCIEDQSQVIYPNFECHSTLPSDTRYRMISDYSKYLEFDNLSISIDEQDYSKIIINPISNTSETDKQKYIEEVQSAITSLGVSPDIFKYYVISSDDLTYYIPNR